MLTFLGFYGVEVGRGKMSTSPIPGPPPSSGPTLNLVQNPTATGTKDPPVAPDSVTTQTSTPRVGRRLGSRFGSSGPLQSTRAPGRPLPSP